MLSAQHCLVRRAAQIIEDCVFVEIGFAVAIVNFVVGVEFRLKLDAACEVCIYSTGTCLGGHVVGVVRALGLFDQTKEPLECEVNFRGWRRVVCGSDRSS